MQDSYVSWEIPIATVSEANNFEHWTKKAKRHKQQQWWIRASFNKYVKNLTLPCEVTLTRVSPRSLDEDNLVMCFKYIRDEISECILPEKAASYVTKQGRVKKIKGRADSDPRIKWQYSQEKGPSGIRVEIISSCSNLESKRSYTV